MTWLYVERADKQRRATIRPVVVFRSDFAARRESEDFNLTSNPLFWRQMDRLHPRKKWKESGFVPADRRSKACLVNDGVGIALNVRAWYIYRQSDPKLAEAALISARGSHFTEDWYQGLFDKDPDEMLIRYEDAETNHYYSHCLYTVNGESGGHERWTCLEGDGPALLVTE